MKYQVRFPGHSIEKKFEKFLLKIHSVSLQEEIMREVNLD